MKKNNFTIKAEDLDTMFDEGEDITPYLDIEQARRPGLKHKKVSVSFPQWMVDQLDIQATTLGVNRQSVIKIWIAERLKHEIS